MKHFLALIILATIGIIPIVSNALEDFDVTLQPEWTNLDENNTTVHDFGGKWMLAGSITFKKKIKEPVSIKRILLTWNGDTINNLIASLYKKDLDKGFLPIEDNLLCDGVWNKAKQTLILNFDEKETLGPVTIFYLVLTVPESLEPLLKTGSFCIDEQCLPAAFKDCANNKTLSLAIGTTPAETPKNPAAQS